MPKAKSVTTRANRPEIVQFADIQTHNQRMRECLRIAQTAAPSGATILILGETGTGKTLLAMAIHNASKRADGPLINCSGVSDGLLESELFGHEKGAFTSAERPHKGKFEQADHGTLFLDEIGNLSQSAQAKILRAVEQKEFEKLGGEETIRSNTRVIAATNSRLEELLELGEFRQDLYFRLSEVLIDLPPLRERSEDIPILVGHFIKQFAAEFEKPVEGVSDVTLNFLARYHWPGNIRELKNVIRRGVMNAQHEQVWLEDLNLRFELVDSVKQPAADEDLSMAAVEKRHIRRVLEMTRGNKKRACEILAISRPTLDRKLGKYKLS